jgi:hypothetical protein
MIWYIFLIRYLPLKLIVIWFDYHTYLYFYLPKFSYKYEYFLYCEYHHRIRARCSPFGSSLVVDIGV